MSEANLNNSETQKPPPDDGSEILQLAHGNYKKGLSRRSFLKLSGAVFASWLLSSCLPEEQSEEHTSFTSTPSPIETTATTNIPSPTETTTPVEQYLQPELVHSIEVFGLRESITTDDQIDKLYQSFDMKFDERVPDSLKEASRWEQRDAVLPKDKRFAEFVVTQSAYDGWANENGVDYVTWAKLHIDLLNRASNNAEPSIAPVTELLRVIVVQDDLILPDPPGSWSSYNPSRYSKDMDGSWSNNSPQMQPWLVPYTWNYFVENDGSSLFYPSGEDIISDRAIKLPPADDNFCNNPHGRVNTATTHELSHQILNLPDEYTYNYDLGDNCNKRFSRFYFDTGAFTIPKMSSHLGYILKYHLEKNIRGYKTDPGGIGMGWESAINAGNKALSYTLHPRTCRFEVIVPDEQIEEVEVFAGKLEGDYYSQRSFPDTPDQTEKQSTFTLNPQLLEPMGDSIFCPLNWVIKYGQKELCLPKAALVMSKIAGNSQANYRIEFSGYDDQTKRTQIVKLIDQSELDEFLEQRDSEGNPYYAKMKVDGTDTWFVWFLA